MIDRIKYSGIARPSAANIYNFHANAICQAGGPLSGQGWRRRERSVSGASTERHRRYVGTAIAGPAATPGRNQRPVK